MWVHVGGCPSQPHRVSPLSRLAAGDKAKAAGPPLRAALSSQVHKLPAAWVPCVSDSSAQSQQVFRAGPRLECRVKCQRGSLLVTVTESPSLRRQEWEDAVPLSLSKDDESARKFTSQGTTEAVRVADG